MPYCPQCLTEYVEGAVECADCRIPLRPGLPPSLPSEESPDLKLVSIRTFSGPTARLDADLARDLLDQEGIPCNLPGEIAAQVLPGIDVVQMLVREEDASRAAELLKSYLDSSEIASDERPQNEEEQP